MTLSLNFRLARHLPRIATAGFPEADLWPASLSVAQSAYLRVIQV